jgi:hypothetical protein
MSEQGFRATNTVFAIGPLEITIELHRVSDEVSLLGCQGDLKVCASVQRIAGHTERYGDESSLKRLSA